MHDVYLGCVAEIASALASRVLNDAEAVKRFRRATIVLQDARLKGLEVTLWRPQNVSSTTEADLVHLLHKKALYARELQELLPLLPHLFHATQLQSLEQLIPPLCDLVIFCSILQMRSWPTNAGGNLLLLLWS